MTSDNITDSTQTQPTSSSVERTSSATGTRPSSTHEQNRLDETRRFTDESRSNSSAKPSSGQLNERVASTKQTEHRKTPSISSRKLAGTPPNLDGNQDLLSLIKPGEKLQIPANNEHNNSPPPSPVGVQKLVFGNPLFPGSSSDKDPDESRSVEVEPVTANGAVEISTVTQPEIENQQRPKSRDSFFEDDDRQAARFDEKCDLFSFSFIFI